jgi:hypothetical protein
MRTPTEDARTPEDALRFRTDVRAALTLLDSGGPELVPRVIEALKAAGAVRNECMGMRMTDGDDTCVRWYAGQALDVLEARAFFAVNSLLNCLDRFCPTVAPECKSRTALVQ